MDGRARLGLRRARFAADKLRSEQRLEAALNNWMQARASSVTRRTCQEDSEDEEDANNPPTSFCGKIFDWFKTFLEPAESTSAATS